MAWPPCRPLQASQVLFSFPEPEPSLQQLLGTLRTSLRGQSGCGPDTVDSAAVDSEVLKVLLMQTSHPPRVYCEVQTGNVWTFSNMVTPVTERFLNSHSVMFIEKDMHSSLVLQKHCLAWC